VKPSRQELACFQRGLYVGIESGLVADHFEFTQSERPTSRPSRAAADGFVRRVGQPPCWAGEIFFGIDVIEQRFLTAVKVDAADGDW